MANKMDIFERRMVNINGDLRERVIYQRHMAEDMFQDASGIIERWIEIWASGILDEDYLLAASSTRLTSPHYTYALDVNFLPDASGTRCIGLASTPWASGAFDELYVPKIVNSVDIYGNLTVHGAVRQINYDEYDVIELNVSGDTKLGDGTDDTIDLVGTIISSSGNILFNDTIAPAASGVWDLGTVSYAFDEAYIDKIYLSEDPVDPLQATTKQYVDAAVEFENLWDRTGTTLVTHYVGDDVRIDGNTYLEASGIFQNISTDSIDASGDITVAGVGTFSDVVIPTIFTSTTEPTGFVDKTAILSFDNATRVFTITGSHDIYINGVRTTKGTNSITISDTTGIHWIYYNAAGILAESSTPDFSLPTVATIYYNTDGGFDKGLLGEERHGIKMDVDTHYLLHYTVGTRYESGLAGTFGNTTFSITTGIIDDEDIALSIGATTTCDILYKDGAADFVWLENQTQYYYNAPSDLYYNNGNVLTPVPANQLVAYWIFATNSKTRPIVSLMGQRVDTNIANARVNNKYESLTLAQLPFEEMKLLYRVILRNDATPYEETQDLRAISNLPAGTYVATQHNALTGLNWAQAGHTIDADVVPTSSGTRDIGTISLAFDEAYIDKVYLENAVPTDLLQATTKQYVDITAATAAGADTQIQFNDGGFFAGDADLTWDKTTETLSVDANVVFNNSGTDRDFRVKSDRESAMLFIDGGNDIVLIGNDNRISSDSTLEIVNHGVTTKVRIATYSATNAESPRIYFHKSSTNTIDILQETTIGDCLGGLVFYGVSTDLSWSAGATIMINQTSDATLTRAPSEMVFETYGTSGTNINQLVLVDDGTITHSDSIYPNASGTLDLGTISLAYDEAYIDKIYLEQDPTTPLMAVTKQYCDSKSFIDLIDTPNSYTDYSASGVRVNATEDGLEFCNISGTGGGGVDTFLELLDTPSNYIGAAASGVRVNATEDGLEFYHASPWGTPASGVLGEIVTGFELEYGSTTTVVVKEGVLCNGDTLISAASDTTLTYGTGADWWDGNQDDYSGAADWCYIGVDVNGNIKLLGNNPPDYSDTAGNALGQLLYWYDGSLYWRVVGAIRISTSNQTEKDFWQHGNWFYWHAAGYSIGTLNASTFTDVDCSGYVPAFSKLCRLSFKVATINKTYELRPNGSTASVGWYYPAGVDTLLVHVWQDIGLDEDQIFEFRVYTAGGSMQSTNMKAFYVGGLRKGM